MLMIILITHAHDDVGVVGNSADYVDVAGNSYTSYSKGGSGQPAGYSYSNAMGGVAVKKIIL